MQGGFPKWLSMTCSNLTDSRNFLVYSCDCGLPGLKSYQTKLDELLGPNSLNHSQEIYRNKTVTEGKSSQSLQ